VASPVRRSTQVYLARTGPQLTLPAPQPVRTPCSGREGVTSSPTNGHHATQNFRPTVSVQQINYRQPGKPAPKLPKQPVYSLHRIRRHQQQLDQLIDERSLHALPRLYNPSVFPVVLSSQPRNSGEQSLLINRNLLMCGRAFRYDPALLQ
jgi:hypothetical protein